MKKEKTNTLRETSPQQFRTYGAVVLVVGLLTFIADLTSRLNEVDILRSLFLLVYGASLIVRSRFAWPKELRKVPGIYSLYQFMLLVCVFIAGYWLHALLHIAGD